MLSALDLADQADKKATKAISDQIAHDKLCAERQDRIDAGMARTERMMTKIGIHIEKLYTRIFWLVLTGLGSLISILISVIILLLRN